MPPPQGLYDPRHEHDSCGVGFVANIKGRKSQEVVACGLEILVNLDLAAQWAPIRWWEMARES